MHGIIEIPVLLAIVAFIVTSAALFATTNPTSVSVLPIGTQTCNTSDPGTVKFTWHKGPAGLHYEVSWEGIAGTTDVGDVGEVTKSGFAHLTTLRWTVRAFDPATEEAGPDATGSFSTQANCGSTTSTPPVQSPPATTANGCSPSSNQVPIGQNVTIGGFGGNGLPYRFNYPEGTLVGQATSTSVTLTYSQPGQKTISVTSQNNLTPGSCTLLVTSAPSSGGNCISSPTTVGTNQQVTFSPTSGTFIGIAPPSDYVNNPGPVGNPGAYSAIRGYFTTAGTKSFAMNFQGGSSTTCSVTVTSTTAPPTGGTSGPFNLQVANQYGSNWSKSITVTPNTYVDVKWNIPSGWSNCAPSFGVAMGFTWTSNDWITGNPDFIANPQGGPHGVNVGSGLKNLNIRCSSATSTLFDTVEITIQFPTNNCVVNPSTVSLGQNVTVSGNGGGGIPYLFQYPSGTLVGQATSTGVTLNYSTPGAKTITVTTPGNQTPGTCTVNVNAPQPNGCLVNPNTVGTNQNVTVSGFGGGGLPYRFNYPEALIVGQATSTGVTIYYPQNTPPSTKTITVTTPNNPTPGSCNLTLTSTAPGQFNVVNPGNNSQNVPANPAFNWTQSAGATKYRIAIMNTAGTNWQWNKIIDGPTTSAGWNNGSGWSKVEAQSPNIPNQLPNGRYRWSASALNTAGQTTFAGNVNEFSVTTIVPTPTPSPVVVPTPSPVPTVPTPSPTAAPMSLSVTGPTGCVTGPYQVTFNWNRAVAQSEVDVDRDNNWDNGFYGVKYFSGGTSTVGPEGFHTTANTPITFDPNQQYYWRVYDSTTQFFAYAQTPFSATTCHGSPSPSTTPGASPAASPTVSPGTSPAASGSGSPAPSTAASPSTTATPTPTNHAPDKPQKPQGPTTGTIGQSLSFTFAGSDPDNQTLEYSIDWGDGNTTTVPNVSSGQSTTATHIWNTSGPFPVKVKTWDGQLTSSYSDALTVTISGSTSSTSCVDVSTKGSPSRKLDITFVPVKYNTSEMSAFRDDVNYAISRINFYHPYPEHPNAINYHRIDIANFNPGNASPSSLLSNTEFKNMANNCPTDITVGVYNDANYDNGVSYLNGYITVYGRQFHHDDPDLLVHELSHAYVGLADEYIIPRTPNAPNCSATNNNTPWQGFPNTSVIGGCSTQSYFRSSQNSVMNEIDPATYNRPDGFDAWNIKLIGDKLNAYDN